jgi:YbbR domain-containing protein
MTYLDTPIDATVSQWPSATASYGDLCDFYNAYHDSAETMKGDIESLNNSISVLKRQNSYANNLLANAKVVILEAFDNDDFDKDVVTNIAEALDIQLTKEYEVTINVTFSGTVSVPLGFDIEGDLENYIDFEARTNGYGSEDIECDLFSDGIDITVNNR